MQSHCCRYASWAPPRFHWRPVSRHRFGGIERRRIFPSQTDCKLFLDRLAEWVIESRPGLYAWALMPNHVHLLRRTGQLPLSPLMQAWLSAYSTVFDNRHRRSGHLFQNRFKSTLVEEEPYLRQASARAIQRAQITELTDAMPLPGFASPTTPS